jgi:hypothetical protein
VYEIQWSDEARADFKARSVFHRPGVASAVDRLRHEAEVETRNRKPLARVLDQFPEARWSLRVGAHRVLYRIEEGPIAQILRVILKGPKGAEHDRGSVRPEREAMKEKPFTISPALARQLDRISERMSREGGIPHEVIVREMREDMARELKRMVATYDGSPRKSKELLEAFLISEAEGIKGVAELRRTLARKLESGKLGRRKAA